MRRRMRPTLNLPIASSLISLMPPVVQMRRNVLECSWSGGIHVRLFSSHLMSTPDSRFFRQVFPNSGAHVHPSKLISYRALEAQRAAREGWGMLHHVHDMSTLPQYILFFSVIIFEFWSTVNTCLWNAWNEKAWFSSVTTAEKNSMGLKFHKELAWMLKWSSHIATPHEAFKTSYRMVIPFQLAIDGERDTKLWIDCRMRWWVWRSLVITDIALWFESFDSRYCGAMVTSVVNHDQLWYF